MNLGKKLSAVATLAAIAAFYAAPASAVQVLCQEVNNNHMYVDSQYVSSCVDAGVGNVNGNPITDDFFAANPGIGYTGIGSGTFTQSLNNTTHDNAGTFSISSSLW